METVDQVIFRYDLAARGFRPVAATLAPADLGFVGTRFTALVDAAYRAEDVRAAPTLSFAQVPDDPHGRGMIICRAPDSSGRLAAAAHVLISPKLAAGHALGLSSTWSGWQLVGAPAQPAPIDLRILVATASEGLRHAQAAARAPECERELVVLVDALLRAGPGRLAVTGNGSDARVLLTGARAILRECLSPDWTFSSGEPAQKPGIRVTFLLPGGRATSEARADLSVFDQTSEYLVAAAVLVTAFRNSANPKAWEEDLKSAGVSDRDSLLAWAGKGAPSAEASRIEAREQARAAAEWEARRREWEVAVAGLKSDVGELRNESTRLSGELESTQGELTKQLAAREQVTGDYRSLAAEHENLRSTYMSIQGLLNAREQDVANLRELLASATAAGWVGEPAAARLDGHAFLVSLRLQPAADAYYDAGAVAPGDQRRVALAKQLRVELVSSLGGAAWEAVDGADCAAAIRQVVQQAFLREMPWDAELELQAMLHQLLAPVAMGSRAADQLFNALWAVSSQLGWSETAREATWWRSYLHYLRAAGRQPATLPVAWSPAPWPSTPAQAESESDLAGRLLAVVVSAVFILIVLGAAFSELW